MCAYHLFDSLIHAEEVQWYGRHYTKSLRLPQNQAVNSRHICCQVVLDTFSSSYTQNYMSFPSIVYLELGRMQEN